MESIQALRERRAHFSKETKKLMEDHPVGSGDKKWGPEQQKVYDQNMAQIDEIDAHIERMQKVLDKDASKAFGEATEEIERIRGGGKRKISAEVARVYNSWLRQGDSGLTAEDWAQVRKNTMSVGTNSQGGFTVQSEVSADLIDALKDYGGMRKVAEAITTSQGNPLSYPQTDGTAETGEIIGENTTATAADPSFTSVNLTTYKFSSKIITVPFELLQDSQVDIEGFIRRRIQQRLGRIQNTKFTVGSGTGEPNGLITASSVGKTGTTGETLTLIYDDLVDLIDSVDIAYQNLNNCGFMFAQATRKVVRKIKDTTGRPIWTPSYEEGITGKFSDELLGYPVTINNDVAVPAANAKSIAFGDFSYYKIRDVMEAMLFRFTDSAYTKLGQVGFLAWMRAGGNLVDANAVKLFQHSAT